MERTGSQPSTDQTLREQESEPHAGRGYSSSQYSRSPVGENKNDEPPENQDLTNGRKEEHDTPQDGGEGAGEGPPRPVGFWHHSLFHVRNHVFRLWVKTTILLCLCILGILSLYWGVLFRVNQNLHELVVFVVDFDSVITPFDTVIPLIGPTVTKATEEIVNSDKPHLGYWTRDPTEFNNDPLTVRRSVFDFHAWAAIIINPNATTMLENSIRAGGNASYDPLGAMQVVYVSARDLSTHSSYVQPMLEQLETHITTTFGQQWAQRVLTNASIPRSTLAKVPQALSPAIGFTQIDLRPFSPPVVTPAVTIGLIYLIIISFFSFSFFLPIHMKYLIPKGHPPLKFHQLVLWRWTATVVAYFFMSLCYSFISLAFQIPFSNAPASPLSPASNSNAYGRATFVVYFMLNFTGMAALGLACENVAMVIGQPWTAMWLIFWVITNVATSFYPLELAPRFYWWGYAWPLHNVVEASKQLLFNLHSRIGLNFGILFAWAAVNSALFPAACYVMRWKSERAKRPKPEHHHHGR